MANTPTDLTGGSFPLSVRCRLMLSKASTSCCVSSSYSWETRPSTSTVMRIVWRCVGLVLLVVTFLLNIERKMRCSFSYIFIWPQFCIKALNLWDNIVKFWIWKLRQGALNHCCSRIIFSAEAIERAKKSINSSTGFLMALNESHAVLNSRQYTAN